MKIGIIGTGISGNLAARLLSQEHDVEVFESSPNVGGHARTLDVDAFGKSWRVDTGFMVFNDRTYPNFCRLLKLLGVSGDRAEMSLSVTCAGSNLEFQGSSLNGLFAQRRNVIRPKFLGMLADIVRFNRAAKSMLACDLGEKTLGDLVSEHGFRGWFSEKYLLPMTAAIWSCPPDRVWDFPAHFLLSFLQNHGLLQMLDRPRWQTITGSSRKYVDLLVGPIRDRIRTDCPALAVRRFEDHVVVKTRKMPPEVFDCVVLACHSDQALALLHDSDVEEREILQSLPYHSNTATLHTDTSILPRRRRAWASWNYSIPPGEGEPVAVTYDLSRLQKLATPTPLLLTLNAEDRIDPSLVLNRHRFEHPRYTGDSLKAQDRLKRRNGQRRTFYCGAYLGYGFHEDGVKSALDVARHFGLGLDQWKAASTKASYTTSA
ncbi:MAG: NAD(P)-binding protein [Isosphaeraceae bacterium]